MRRKRLVGNIPEDSGDFNCILHLPRADKTKSMVDMGLTESLRGRPPADLGRLGRYTARVLEITPAERPVIEWISAPEWPESSKEMMQLHLSSERAFMVGVRKLEIRL